MEVINVLKLPEHGGRDSLNWTSVYESKWTFLSTCFRRLHASRYTSSSEKGRLLCSDKTLSVMMLITGNKQLLPWMLGKLVLDARWATSFISALLSKISSSRSVNQIKFRELYQENYSLWHTSKSESFMTRRWRFLRDSPWRRNPISWRKVAITIQFLELLISKLAGLIINQILFIMLKKHVWPAILTRQKVILEKQ